MIFITSLGNGGVIWIVISILLLCNKKYRVFGIAGLFALILNAILGEGLIKNIVQRPRPFVTMKDINIMIKGPNSYSFPSGHTSSAIAVMTVITYYKSKMSNIKPYIIFMWFITVLIIFSRLYLTVHYLSDILGGIVLGGISAITTIGIFKKYTATNSKLKE